MDGYQLDTQGMSTLIDNLGNAADRITSANNKLKDASPSDLGSNVIDSAGRAFQDRWEYGTGKIADATGKMVEALELTKCTYETIEQEISRLFPAPPAAGGTAPAAPEGDPGSAISSRLGGGR